MNCPRCSGLMMRDDYFDLQDEAGRCTFVAWRCLICGEVLDPVILKHREAPPAPMVDRARPLLHRTVSVRTRKGAGRSRDPWNDPDGAALALGANELADLDLGNRIAAELEDVDV
ncbi:MAG: hypothetical protein H8K06_08640 [Nitrospira sp.]|uniref:Uncharacterized protein n=1 Tax=Nitrospira defluvii TaxID=330214 RepID=A0ABM8QLF8_9BACT|nr:hypothetical protein [Nitrospira defluvii]MCS6327137.1 hypothetical protein [Nitrospira sp.]CAE6703242.1 hypothetical protein NSPZN2_10841 [Nitrospira defluvii]